MARTGITFEMVAKAATQLSLSDKNPTVDRVRSVVGTGSKSTIAKHLKRWRVQAELSENHGDAEASDTIPDALMDLMKQFWRDFYRMQCADVAARQHLESSQHRKNAASTFNAEKQLAIDKSLMSDLKVQLQEIKQALVNAQSSKA